MRLILLAAAITGATLGLWQPSPAKARFEYGVTRVYTGTVLTDPFPILLTTTGEAIPLVGLGKHAASTKPGPAELHATLIERGPRRMLEVASLRPFQFPSQPAKWRSLGPAAITGELVDTKCWHGVMNPGAGKTHRACAARCLHGGIPAALATRDGRLVYLPKADPAHAGETLSVTGELTELNGLLVLRPAHHWP